MPRDAIDVFIAIEQRSRGNTWRQIASNLSRSVGRRSLYQPESVSKAVRDYLAFEGKTLTEIDREIG